MAVIKIDVIFDIVCAWCYIGRRTLDKAITLHQKTYPGGKDDIFQITWHPYYLNYGWIAHEPAEGAECAAESEGACGPPPHLSPSMDKSAFAKIKLGHLGDDQIAMHKQRVQQIGRSVGIEFKHGGKVGSTRAAHHLIWLARQKDGNNNNVYGSSVGTALVDKLFEAYHEKEMDITTRRVLRGLAVGEEGVGLDPVEVDGCLDFCFEPSADPFDAGSAVATSKFAASIAVEEGGKVESAVDKEARESRERTNSGVPLFIVQGKYRVQGAQDLSDFIEIFGKIREEAN